MRPSPPGGGRPRPCRGGRAVPARATAARERPLFDDPAARAIRYGAGRLGRQGGQRHEGVALHRGDARDLAGQEADQGAAAGRCVARVEGPERRGLPGDPVRLAEGGVERRRRARPGIAVFTGGEEGEEPREEHVEREEHGLRARPRAREAPRARAHEPDDQRDGEEHGDDQGGRRAPLGGCVGGRRRLARGKLEAAEVRRAVVELEPPVPGEIRRGVGQGPGQGIRRRDEPVDVVERQREAHLGRPPTREAGEVRERQAELEVVRSRRPAHEAISTPTRAPSSKTPVGP
jgi:hypothetical protein